MMASRKAHKVLDELGRNFYIWWENQFEKRDDAGQIIHQLDVGRDSLYDLYWNGRDKNRFLLKLDGINHIISYENVGNDSRPYFCVFTPNSDIERVKEAVVSARMNIDEERRRVLRSFYGSPKVSCNVADIENLSMGGNTEGTLVKSVLLNVPDLGKRPEFFSYAKKYIISPINIAVKK